jgi:hypothetical protein
MSRMTYRLGGKGPHGLNDKASAKVGLFTDYDGFFAHLQAVEKLGAIEDIIYALDGTEIITLDRIRELVEADRDGRLVVLPCKVGDTVYTVDLDCRDNPDQSKMCFCWNKSCKDCDKAYLRVWENHTKTADVRSIVSEMGLCGEKGGFGKTVFLTRELAEEALKNVQEKL